MNAAVTSLNAVDLLMAVVIAAILVAGWRGQVISEFIKLLGIFCATFIALHYYIHFANFLKFQFFGKDASTEFPAFAVLAVLFCAVFVVISYGWVLILKLKLPPKIDRYGGSALALVRSYFTCGLIFFMLILAQHPTITPMAKTSVSCAIFRHVAENFYRAAYAALIENFFPGEKMNAEALAVTAKRKNEK